MKVDIHYTSFNLRKDTESIVATAGAIAFFNDHDIPYILEERDMFGGGKKEMITWHESATPIELVDFTLDVMHEYANRYELFFQIGKESVSIHFIEK